jgi:hypothetical protein
VAFHKPPHPRDAFFALELSEETKKLDDAVPIALNLQRPGSVLSQDFMALIEDHFLDPACGSAEKAVAKIVDGRNSRLQLSC